MAKKKEIKKQKIIKSHYLYLSMVSAVAVVAVVVLLLNVAGTSESVVELVDEESNIVGEAYRISGYKYLLPTTKIQKIQPKLQLLGTVKKGDLFLLSAPGVDDSVGEILEYMGADRSSQTNPEISFRQWKTGNSLNSLIQNGQATIRLGGKSFKVELQQPTLFDSPLAIDYDGDGVVDSPKVGNLNYKNKYVEGLGCPTCLKDYSIGAYASRDISNQGNFNINNRHFFDLRTGNSNTLPTGEVITLGSTSVQTLAGGLSGVDFDFNNACPNDYSIIAYHLNRAPNTDKGQFNFNGEQFELEVGEEKVLSDGSKVILKELLVQDYAGGVYGPLFELIC